MLERALDWVFPPKCMACGQLLPPYGDKWFCGPCRDALPYAPRPEHPRRSGFCERNGVVFVYEGGIREAIRSFKFSGLAYFARGLAPFMTDAFNREFAGTVDALVPVPIHKLKERARGFNQSALLAWEISALTGTPTLDGVLIRRVNTQPQYGLSHDERVSNVKGAFSIKGEEKGRELLKGKRLLLIDDIYTTGSTIEECAETLQKGGAAGVASLCLSAAAGLKTE